MSRARSMTKFTVKGRFPFPVDMLRYDSCWPANGESAAAIHHSIARDGDREQSVTLLTWSTGITPARWASFGWTVIEQERV